MGCVHPGTRRGMFLQRIGSRKTVPPKIFLMVPFGLFHIFFSLNSVPKNIIYPFILINLKHYFKPTLNSSLIWGDGGTLDSHVVLPSCQGRVDGDLVICLITVGQPEVKVLQLHIDIWQDELQTYAAICKTLLARKFSFLR